MLRRLTGLLVAILLSAAAPAAAQTAPDAAAPGTRLRVFLECGCFDDFLREEINWVDFVRQPQDADVHILSTVSNTGGGGIEYVVRFVGLSDLSGQDLALRALILPSESEDARRRSLLRTVSVGLLSYVARGGLPGDLSLAVSSSDAPGAAVPAADPWRAWVFSVRGDVSMEAEESNRETTWVIGLTADRVTDTWKIASGVRLDQRTERFDLDDDDPFTVRRHDRRGDLFVARSLGEHWSAGIDSSVRASTFGNVKFAAELQPAIEYNVFPYSQYATRQLRLSYGIGVQHAAYNEVTLFDRLKETRGRHQLTAVLDQRQPWGSLQARAEWSQYLHDFGKYRLEVDGGLSFRVVRGLSVDLDVSASRIRDQLSLPRREADPAEVLLRLRELLSGYEVDMRFGIRYTFGSIFNNIVNPRFGD